MKCRVQIENRSQPGIEPQVLENVSVKSDHTQPYQRLNVVAADGWYGICKPRYTFNRAGIKNFPAISVGGFLVKGNTSEHVIADVNIFLPCQYRAQIIYDDSEIAAQAPFLTDGSLDKPVDLQSDINNPMGQISLSGEGFYLGILAPGVQCFMGSSDTDNFPIMTIQGYTRHPKWERGRPETFHMVECRIYPHLI